VLAVALAIGSSLVYGVSDFLGGVKSRTLPLVSVLLVSQGSALVLLAIFVIARGGDPPGGQFLVYAAIAGLSEAVGVAALYRGLAVGVMSIVTPIAGTAPAVPVVAAIALGELPDPLQGAGIALAVIGVAIISYTPSTENASSREVVPSLVFGLLTALGFGGFLVAMDAASEGSVPWALLVARATSVSIFAVAFLIQRKSLAVSRADVPVLILIGTLIIAADAMYAVASTEGLLSVVAVLSSLYPVVTIALARVYLQERIDRHQQLGVAVALAGVAIISASQA
jgi:drug/metabolite transporter (DMT)-like permease